MMRLISVITALVMWHSLALAFEIEPIISTQDVAVKMRSVEFPDYFPKDLTSGLQTRVVFIVDITESSNQPIQSQHIEIASRYDLWKENFAISTRYNGALKATQTLNTTDATMD